MRADDPRHGTMAGYNAHTRSGFPICGSCRLAKRRYDKRRIMAGGFKVSTLGSRRRVEALRALGYSLNDIAAAAGYKPVHSAIKYVMTAETMTASTAARIDRAFEALCMTPATGPRAGRNRRHAARMGWPPPLAWADIDDPNEQPENWHYIPNDRGDALAELEAMGFGISEVCRRLELRRDNLERWCQRNGMAATFSRLVAREQPDYERFATGRRAS